LDPQFAASIQNLFSVNVKTNLMSGANQTIHLNKTTAKQKSWPIKPSTNDARGWSSVFNQMC